MQLPLIPRVIVAVTLLSLGGLIAALQPLDVQAQSDTIPQLTFEGYRNIQTHGNDTTWMQAFTHRYVDGELRFLTLTNQGSLHEFNLGDARLNSGDVIRQTTGRWNLAGTGALNSHNGIWYETERSRLWVTSAEDYTSTNYPARITLLTLGANGSVSVQKAFYLNVPAKRVYGGCNKVPAKLVTRIGGPYVCGWGGYTSLVAQGGRASIGPTMYAIPDPDSIANGATASARTILDHVDTRGVRKTIPVNYFDGGDPRQNPPTRPTAPPLPSASWLSPSSEGLGWWVWGDSYYNTGTWIGTTYAAVASLCRGACWYQTSTLEYDGRQFELHLWDGNLLGESPTQRPFSMTELQLPRGNAIVWSGNVPTGNIAGATYDPVSRRLYLIGFPLGPDEFTGRLFSFSLGSGTPSPGDAVVSDWSAWLPLSAWSVCGDAVQTRLEERTRTVLVPATGGGVTPPLRETRMSSLSCGANEGRGRTGPAVGTARPR